MKATMKNLVLRGGIYYVRKMVRGKRETISTGCKDAKLAERRAIEILRDLHDGKRGWKKKEVPTFDAWAMRHVTANSRNNAKKLARDTNFMKRAIVIWSGRPIDSIHGIDCQELMNWLRGGPRPGEKTRRKEDGPKLGDNTVITETVVLGGVFTAAVRAGVIERNPWTGTRRPQAISRERVLTRDEQAALAAQCSEEYQRLLLCFLGTGLRANEMLALEKDEINFKKNRIELPASKTKTKKSRLVPLQPAVVDAFKTQIALREKDDDALLRSHCGGTKRKNRSAIFNMGRGAALDVFQKAGRAGKIEDEFTIHDFRRTFGTRCAEAGMPIKTLSMIMGHSDIAVTATYYIHIGDENLDRALQAVDLGLTPALLTDKVLKAVA